MEKIQHVFANEQSRKGNTTAAVGAGLSLVGAIALTRLLRQHKIPEPFRPVSQTLRFALFGAAPLAIACRLLQLGIKSKIRAQGKSNPRSTTNNPKVDNRDTAHKSLIEQIGNLYTKGRRLLKDSSVRLPLTEPVLDQEEKALVIYNQLMEIYGEAADLVCAAANKISSPEERQKWMNSKLIHVMERVVSRSSVTGRDVMYEVFYLYMRARCFSVQGTLINADRAKGQAKCFYKKGSRENRWREIYNKHVKEYRSLMGEYADGKDNSWIFDPDDTLSENPWQLLAATSDLQF